MDKRPKRRKSKDNPYTLISNKKLEIYKISFIDSSGNSRCIEISEEIYNVFDKFELEDLSQMNKYDRYIEHFDHTEESLHNKARQNYIMIEERVIEKIFIDRLHKEIDSLPIVQKNRLKKYYFDEKTLKEIAQEEKCSRQAVRSSVDIGIKKISESLKKFKF